MHYEQTKFTNFKVVRLFAVEKNKLCRLFITSGIDIRQICNMHSILKSTKRVHTPPHSFVHTILLCLNYDDIFKL